MRFVSTPEVLERFVTIEREITQIESEQANGGINVEGMLSMNFSNDHLTNHYFLVIQFILC